MTYTLELTEQELNMLTESVRENEERKRAFGMHRKAEQLAELLYRIQLKIHGGE